MLANLLNEYLKITQEMLKIDDYNSMDVFDALLKKRALIQKDIDKELKVELDEKLNEIVRKIVEADSQLTKRIKQKMSEIEQGIDQVKKDRLAHGKNKLAFKKFIGKTTGGTGYYFDRKK